MIILRTSHLDSYLTRLTAMMPPSVDRRICRRLIHQVPSREILRSPDAGCCIVRVTRAGVPTLPPDRRILVNTTCCGAVWIYVKVNARVDYPGTAALLRVEPLHCLAVRCHEVVDGGEDGVVAAPTVDLVATGAQLPAYAVEPVVADAAPEHVGPTAALHRVAAPFALDTVVAGAAVEALGRRAYLEAGVVAPATPADEIITEAPADPVLAAPAVEHVAAAIALDQVVGGGAHDRLRVVGAHQGGREGRPRRECHQQRRHREHRRRAPHPLSFLADFCA